MTFEEKYYLLIQWGIGARGGMCAGHSSAIYSEIDDSEVCVLSDDEWRRIEAGLLDMKKHFEKTFDIIKYRFVHGKCNEDVMIRFSIKRTELDAHFMDARGWARSRFYQNMLVA